MSWILETHDGVSLFYVLTTSLPVLVVMLILCIGLYKKWMFEKHEDSEYEQAAQVWIENSHYFAALFLFVKVVYDSVLGNAFTDLFPLLQSVPYMFYITMLLLGFGKRWTFVPVRGLLYMLAAPVFGYGVGMLVFLLMGIEAFIK